MPRLRRTVLNSGWEFVAQSWPTPPDKLGYSRMEWLPASVPGHVHLDLVDNGVLADPMKQMHELGAQWVDEEDWTYRKRLKLGELSQGTKRMLRFEGLDTVCRVRLDGEVIAKHDNMFLPLEIDVSDRLTPSGEHELSVEFQSAPRVGRERRAAYLQKEQLPDNVVRFSDRAFVRKAQCMFGWDWGPRLVSAGIWRDVVLVEYSARIHSVQVQQAHHDDGSVTLTFRSEVEGDAEIHHFIDGIDGIVRDGESIRLPRPQLWWPNGFGPQQSYLVHSLLVPRGASPTRSPEHLFDSKQTRIGLRRVRLLRQPDSFGQSFRFEVNGRELWALGANWIPDHCFPSAVDRERLRDRLTQAQDMGMNMIRVWGGGLYESDDFYDLCDELGLLVWQDFAFACSYYPDGADAEASTRAEAQHQVKRLRNHPSLALWCGNNENLTMFQNSWEGRSNNPPRYYGQKLYEQTLPAVLRELDPDRPYVPTSPWGGERCNDGGIGDQHYWDVWHGRGDWKHYEDSKARFSSEFGFASAPGPASWRRVTPDALQLPSNHRLARWHDKTLKGYDTFIGYVELHYPKASTLEEWTYYSQLNQRDALRFGIEHYRRSEFCKGALVWQLNDCWPAQSWAVIDFDGHYKASAFELRRLCAPAIAGTVFDGGQLRVWAALDNSAEESSHELRLCAHDLRDGATLDAWTARVALHPGQRTTVLRVAVNQFSPKTTLLTLSYAGGVSHRLLCEPKHVRVSQTSVRARAVTGGIEISCDLPVLELFLWDDEGDGRFVDNFVTLPSGGSRVLRTRGTVKRLRARSLAGPHFFD